MLKTIIVCQRVFFGARAGKLSLFIRSESECSDRFFRILFPNTMVISFQSDWEKSKLRTTIGNHVVLRRLFLLGPKTKYRRHEGKPLAGYPTYINRNDKLRWYLGDNPKYSKTTLRLFWFWLWLVSMYIQFLIFGSFNVFGGTGLASLFGLWFSLILPLLYLVGIYLFQLWIIDPFLDWLWRDRLLEY